MMRDTDSSTPPAGTTFPSENSPGNGGHGPKPKVAPRSSCTVGSVTDECESPCEGAQAPKGRATSTDFRRLGRCTSLPGQPAGPQEAGGWAGAGGADAS